MAGAGGGLEPPPVLHPPALIARRAYGYLSPKSPRIWKSRVYIRLGHGVAWNLVVKVKL